MHIEYIFKPSCLEKGAGGCQPTRHRDYNDGHQEKDGLSSAWPLPGYDQTGKDWHFEKTLDPTWDDIIASIDRLDKFRYPWLWLFIGDETEHATVDCLTIMGGDGVYWLGLSAGKYEQLRLSDPQKGTHEIELWTSDQGFADEERYVTYDRELVLKIARYFGETGEPLPEAAWESL